MLPPLVRMESFAQEAVAALAATPGDGVQLSTAWLVICFPEVVPLLAFSPRPGHAAESNIVQVGLRSPVLPNLLLFTEGRRPAMGRQADHTRIPRSRWTPSLTGG